MTDKYVAPRTVALIPGRPLAPEPLPAVYASEVPDEVYQLIDDICPQDVAETGTVLNSLNW